MDIAVRSAEKQHHHSGWQLGHRIDHGEDLGGRQKPWQRCLLVRIPNGPKF
jgi:hypothetical protein